MEDASPRPPRLRLNRRALLVRGGQAAGLAAAGFFFFEGLRGIGSNAPAAESDADAAHGLTPGERTTLQAVLDRILPPGPGPAPGATAAGTIEYLDRLMASSWIRQESKTLLRDGARNLDAFAQGRGAAGFAELPAAVQEAALHSWEGSPGGLAFLRQIITYALEGFFGDPCHGGNRDGVAWAWIDHRPGSPRPDRADWTPSGR